ncbi:MAG: 50S ribosomal protein L17, partial [Thermogutta sp.]|nr:50S ribosomal protein L17 [Thermogutta sp.]
IAPRFTDRPGGYTRIVRLAKPRVGDAGIRAILALVGNNDRPKKKRRAPSVKPEFTSQEATAPVLGSSDGVETESPQTSA